MKMFTFKLKPKTLFGIILAATGVIVIILTFIGNHVAQNETESVSAVISASTDEERRAYLESFGWSVGADCEEKELTIPESWNEVYNEYNEIQINQGFNLADYKGRAVTLYTYTITNYEDLSEGVLADMLVCDGNLIGGDICSTSAQDGFIVGFNGE